MDIKCRELLEAHDRFAMYSEVKDALGFGYLEYHNPIFRNIVSSAITLGAKCVGENRFDYYAFPQVGLKQMLENATFPYIPNYPALAKVVAALPEVTREEANIDCRDLRPVLLLHELSHFISYRIIRQGELDPRSPKDEKRLVLAALVGEAFGISSEVITGVFATSDIHRIFHSDLSANTYGTRSAEFDVAMIRAISDLGFRATFKTLILCFLYWNFLYKKIGPDEVANITSLLDLDVESNPRMRRHVLAIAKWTFSIPNSFRVKTASFYFHYIGLNVNKSAFQLTSFDFVRMLKRDEVFSTAIDKMAEVAEEGHLSKTIQAMKTSNPAAKLALLKAA